MGRANLPRPIHWKGGTISLQCVCGGQLFLGGLRPALLLQCPSTEQDQLSCCSIRQRGRTSYPRASERHGWLSKVLLVLMTPYSKLENWTSVQPMVTVELQTQTCPKASSLGPEDPMTPCVCAGHADWHDSGDNFMMYFPENIIV